MFFHCDMLHSGSKNRAADGAWRYMVTSFVVRAGLPHRDDFAEAPLVKALIAEAEATGDRRALRFFRADDALQRELLDARPFAGEPASVPLSSASRTRRVRVPASTAAWQWARARTRRPSR